MLASNLGNDCEALGAFELADKRDQILRLQRQVQDLNDLNKQLKQEREDMENTATKSMCDKDMAIATLKQQLQRLQQKLAHE